MEHDGRFKCSLCHKLHFIEAVIGSLLLCHFCRIGYELGLAGKPSGDNT